MKKKFKLQLDFQNFLPVKFKNKIVKSDDPNVAVLRCNLQNIDDCGSWVREFSKLTNTQWNSERSWPNGTAMVCRKRYVCHHSAFQKVDPENNKRGFSKNTGCKAKLNIKIKKSTKDTKKKDSFVKQGLCAIITLDLNHNHSLHSADELKFLSKDNEVRGRFEEYFSDGMGVSESKRFHEGILEIEGATEIELANNRINPTNRCIQYWYNEWRLQNLEPRTEAGIFDKFEEKKQKFEKNGIDTHFTEEPLPFSIGFHRDRDYDSVSSVEVQPQMTDGQHFQVNDEREDINVIVARINSLLRAKIRDIPVNRDDLLEFERRLNAIVTEGQLASFLAGV